MADPGYLSNAQLAQAVQDQTNRLRDFKDDQIKLYTSADQTVQVKDVDGNPVTLTSYRYLVDQTQRTIDAAMARALVSAGIFPDVASGVAATRDGYYFQTPSADSQAYLSLYRNVGGNAIHVGEAPGAGMVASLVQMLARLTPDAHDDHGNVVAVALADASGKAPVYTTDQGAAFVAGRVFGVPPADPELVGQVIAGFGGPADYGLTARGGFVPGNAQLEVVEVTGPPGIVFVDHEWRAFAAMPGYAGPADPIPLLGSGSDPHGEVYEGIVRADFELISNLGQSNSTGTGENVALTTTQPYGNLMPNGGVRPGNDPAQMASLVPLVEYRNPEGGKPPGGGAGETGMASWANDLIALTQQDTGQGYRDQLTTYVAYTGGEGGRPIGYFLPTADGTGAPGWVNWLNRLKRIVPLMRDAAVATGGSIAYLVDSWQQGEAEMNGVDGGSKTEDDYLAKLLNLEDVCWQAIRQQIPEQAWRRLFVIGQLSAHNTYGPTNPDGTPSPGYCHPYIATAQWKAARQSANIRIANPQYFFDFLNQAPATTLHMTAQSHLWQGKYFARLTRLLVADREARRPLGNYSVEMRSAVRSGQRITVTFNVPRPPLVIDTDWVEAATHYGFAIWTIDDQLLDIIDVVKLAGPATLVIHITGDLPAGAQLWAGRGFPGDGAGIGRGHNPLVPAGARTNLRDSAGDDDHYTAGDGVERYLHNWCVIHHIDIQ